MGALVALCAAAGTLVFSPAAFAKTYTDVHKGYWARSDISWITNRGYPKGKVLDDFAGGLFKPTQAVTRAQFARALVVAGGFQSLKVPTVPLADVPASDPYYRYIEIAVHLKLMSVSKNRFHSTMAVLEYQADSGAVCLLRALNPTADWTVLQSLRPSKWEPNPKWSTGAPGYLAVEVAARSLGLRFNHESKADALEVSPRQAISRAEVAVILYRALHVSSWSIAGLSEYDNVVLPTLTARQKQIVAFAFKYIGYPYIWGGEYPTKKSPYGTQAHGGFDCSGFDWWVMKMNFGYTLNERTAAGMAGAAKPRITRAKLVPGDLIFFGPNGPKSTAASIYHAALYLGNGWFIQSTGSLDGVGLSSLDNDSYWKSAFAWGRRVLSKAQFGALLSAAPMNAASTTPRSVAPATPPGSATPSPAATATPTQSATPATVQSAAPGQ